MRRATSILPIFLFPLLCFTQKVLEMESAKQDTFLDIHSYDCTGEKRIIKNDDYYIYQNENYWTKFYPDMKTFKRFDENFGFDKNAMYYKGVKVATDTVNFKILGSRREGKEWITLWKTNKGVYKGVQKLEYNPQYYNALKPYSKYTYDDKNVYYNDEKIDLDPKTTSCFVGDNIIWDAKNSYKNGKKITYKGEKIEQINASFYKTSKFILIWDYNSQRFNEFLSDVENFKILSKSYSMSNDSIYYNEKSIPIKKENFKAIKIWEGSRYIYITDGVKVYFKSGYDTRENLDAKTFGVYDNSEIYYDKNGIYYRDYNRLKDKIVDVKLPFKYTSAVSSKNSFVIDDYPLEVVYNNQIYNRGVVYDVTKEEIIKAKEGNLILEKIKGEKMDTIFSSSLKKGGNKIYWNKQETAADAKTFKKLFGRYYVDDKNVYLINDDFMVLEGVDASSIKRLGNFYKDKNYLYSRNIRIISSENIELLGVFRGYRMQCSMDSSPTSDYYIFKNIEGYWLVSYSREIKIKKLGKKLPEKLQMELDKKFNWKING